VIGTVWGRGYIIRDASSGAAAARAGLGENRLATL
jgi:hypothetical protein